jgi:NhaA family Na+:H+ antiporter
VFFTGKLSLLWLGGAALILLSLAMLNRGKVTNLLPYLLLGAMLWIFTYLSGVHATLAGVALAATIPIRCSPAAPDNPASPLHKLEHALQPWVAYIVLPVFAFANAGVSLTGLSFAMLLQPVTVGIAAGLFFGKQIGVFLVTYAAIHTKLADTPEDATMFQVYGVSLLCGIGFTMSLFIGSLAFPQDVQVQVKVGVLAGSLLSGLTGATVLLLAKREDAPTARRSSMKVQAAVR